MASEQNWKMRAIESAEKAAERARQIVELEQRLAQAREEVDRLDGVEKALHMAQIGRDEYAASASRLQKRAEIAEENLAQARALLETTVTIFSVIVDVGIRNANRHLENIRAFLAQQQEPSNGK